MPKAKRKVMPIIMVGDTFGDFSVVQAPERKLARAEVSRKLLLIRHVCGATYPTSAGTLLYQTRSFCPACMSNPIKIGDRFERYVVIAGPDMRLHKTTGRARPFWRIRCDCEAQYTIPADRLKSGGRWCPGCQPNPSGCRRSRTQAEKDNIAAHSRTHGMSKSPEYSVWRGMLDRCTNPKNKKWHLYGGSKIKVCPTWMESFDAFFRDMGPRPSPRHTLDRLNGKRGYEPDNCAWRTYTEQNRNRRNTVMLDTPDGPRPLAEFTGDAVVSHSLVTIRMKRLGWSFERAKYTPSQSPGPRGPRRKRAA